MADIKILDGVGASTDLGIRDASAIAEAGIKHIDAAAKELLTSFDQPLNQVMISEFDFGAFADTPGLLSAGLPTLTLEPRTNGKLKIIQPSAKTLFPSDNVSPVIPIAGNQAWVAVELNAAVKACLSASFNAVGVSFTAGGALACTTYSMFATTPPAPLPLLREVAATAFSQFTITASAQDIRSQTPNTVNQTEVSGYITSKVTLSLPYSINAMASAKLPFNTNLSVQPSVTVQVSGSLKVSGDFIFRCFKDSGNQVQIGIYKKQGETLTVAFTAAAAIGGDEGSTDVLGQLLNAALPGVDVGKSGLSDADAKTLNGVIKDGIDRSLGAQLNAQCSAAFTDEAAVVYQVDLDQPGQKDAIDAALTQALGGDWTGMKDLAAKGLAKPLRDITIQTQERKWTATLNLFGIYSATSVQDYVKTCTVMVDDAGQLSIIDKADQSRISAATSPYASDPQKLIKALMQDFVATASYALVAGKLGLQLKVKQSYLDYRAAMPIERVEENLLLAAALGLIPAGSLDAQLAGRKSFVHALFSSAVSYDNDALLQLFFSDIKQLTPRKSAELEKIGRQTMATFLQYDNSNIADLRRQVLGDDAVWAAMDDIGDSTAWSTIDGFPNLHGSEGNLAIIANDWSVIRWWAKAVAGVGPAVQAALAAAAAAKDPRNDPQFNAARNKLVNALGSVAKNTDSITPQWGEAVMFATSGGRGKAMMDITWNGAPKTHYGPAQV